MLSKRQHYFNSLLAALPADEINSLTPHLELVSLSSGFIIHEPGTPIRHVYFPTSAVVSLLYDMDDGALVEAIVVGKEGMVGVSVFLGGESALSRAVVQSAGYAYRLKGECLKREFLRPGSLQNILLRYTQALLTEMAQTLVCVRHHSLAQRLSRYLLKRFDRLSSNVLEISQESIAILLGVRRAAISAIAVNLRKAGLIDYERGRIVLLDRTGLEKQACGCYAAVINEQGRLLQWENDEPACQAECSPNPVSCNLPRLFCPVYHAD
jgi:CRP-like cAMP-binding protein